MQSGTLPKPSIILTELPLQSYLLVSFLKFAHTFIAKFDLQRLSLLGSDPQKYVANMLTRLSRWTLRQCLLELQVMLDESKEDILPEQIAK